MTIEDEVAYLIDREFRQQYLIAEVRLPAGMLGVGMVMVTLGLEVVKTVQYFPMRSPATVLINGEHEHQLNREVRIWEMNGKPFLIEFPDHMVETHIDPKVPPTGAPPTPATAHTAVGLIPRLMRQHAKKVN